MFSSVRGVSPVPQTQNRETSRNAREGEGRHRGQNRPIKHTTSLSGAVPSCQADRPFYRERMRIFLVCLALSACSPSPDAAMGYCTPVLARHFFQLSVCAKRCPAKAISAGLWRFGGDSLTPMVKTSTLITTRLQWRTSALVCRCGCRQQSVTHRGVPAICTIPKRFRRWRRARPPM